MQDDQQAGPGEPDQRVPGQALGQELLREGAEERDDHVEEGEAPEHRELRGGARDLQQHLLLPGALQPRVRRQ